MERVHPATVYRYDKLVITTGSVDRVKRKPGRKRKMSTKDALSLFFYKTIYPAAQLRECKSFLRVTQGSDFSHSTISRELRNLALTYKAMRYYSKNRNETD